MAILTNICEKHKYTSPSAIQVKNQLQAIGIEGKLDVKAKLKKVNKLLTCGVTLGWIIVVYLQFVIMLIELKKVLGVLITLNANNLKQRVFVCAASLSKSYRNEPYQKLWICISYAFIALEINKYIV